MSLETALMWGACLAFVVILMAYSPDTRVAVIVGLGFSFYLPFIMLKVSTRKMRLLPASEISVDQKSSQ